LLNDTNRMAQRLLGNQRARTLNIGFYWFPYNVEATRRSSAAGLWQSLNRWRQWQNAAGSAVAERTRPDIEER